MINGMGNNRAGTVCREIRRGLFVVTCTAKIFSKDEAEVQSI